MDNSSSAEDSITCRITLWINHDQLPVEDEGDATINDGGFVNVELRFFRVLISEEGFNAAEEEEVGRRQIQVGRGGVVTMEERPVLDARRALTELGVVQESHVIVIATILEYISRADYPAMVTVNVFEEVAGQTPMEINDQQLELVEDNEAVFQVARMRRTISSDNIVIHDELDMIASEWMEVDTTNVNTVPANEEAIARLEKVRREEDADLHCAICMEDEEDVLDEEFRRMPCAHFFHSECLVPWLRISGSCPLCRLQLPCS